MFLTLNFFSYKYKFILFFGVNMTNLSELERINTVREIIRDIINNKGRDYLYDLTGLSGEFNISEEDNLLIDTYVGPAIFSEKLNNVGVEYFKGNRDIHKAVGFNRTSSAIFSTICALSNTIDKVVHFVPKLPSHPSIPKSCNIFNIEYFESDNLKNILENIDNKTLTIVTGATMDHTIVNLEDLKTIVEYCNKSNSIIFIDDASGARLRILKGQPTALELNCDLVVTSTDKLMTGPRAGLLCGKKNIVDKIYLEGLKYGLEAQTPILCSMSNAIANFKIDNLKKALERAKNINLSKLNDVGLTYEKTPTGFIITNLSNEEYIKLGLKLLKNYGIITITVGGAPGASKTIRIDFCSKDANKVSDKYIINSIIKSVN